MGPSTGPRPASSTPRQHAGPGIDSAVVVSTVGSKEEGTAE